ncbi:polymorphic toxin-type HINT domain-containing protein [Streptomyces sp. NBC_00059]|uniref:polymorphic toxin-type HINT domain-containing protein n=1 Tax=Streptomyces sp. NBC_00059 TaxID=2975635 RepID=UPI00224DAC2D|nr:polymorphic toxin-type HINT domain-containing protein [Streptomyces sp. NBC_00059]MCX5417292.1 polymorphic toxin-type HINT domain-containing protein [Streptomyces sp. NBC_00059]
MAFGIGTSRRGPGGARRWGRRLVAPAVTLALLTPLGDVQGAIAVTTETGRSQTGSRQPDVPEPRVSKVDEVKGLGARKARDRVAAGEKTGAAQVDRARREQKANWPEGGTASLRLTADKRAEAELDGTSVSLSPGKGRRGPAAGTARVTVLDQNSAEKAGITGVLLSAAADTAGAAEISIGYGDFASALGGDWSQRLRLVRLPSCVLTTPAKAECREQTPIETDNDFSEQSLSAQVTLAEAEPGGASERQAASTQAPSTTVLAVTAAAAGSGASPGGTGNYSATQLSPSSSWEAGGSSGAFAWNYGFTVPPAAAGPTPSLALSYDSGSVDGRTATTNNQGSAVGEGFTLTESYIERTYGSCDDDGHADISDQCWKYDNARIVLNGSSSRLIKSASGDWHLEEDDASTVTRSTGADNGDDNGEHWTVITGDGTKYVFGSNKLDGAADQRTNSTWTTPVFGDDAGEPGYDQGSSFAGRALTQAWRWNLDYVEDTRGNASTYWYTKESNYYPKNEAATANTAYVRGGYLREIKYGLRKGALFTDDADAKVTLAHAERCTVGACTDLKDDTAKYWPDVPFDAICTDGDTECNAAGPSFFSRKRLTGVSTFAWNATTKGYDPVDSWALTQDYRDAGDIGDTTDHVLVLESVKRTGKSGTKAIDVAPVTFTYQLRPNRVDGTDDILPLKRHRLETITSETGSITTVTLSQPECRRSEVLAAAQDTNTRSCYPQFWNINGASEASVDWFHKYRVLAVGVDDPTGQNETVEHAYDYSGAAWHHSDDPFTPKDERTWSDWRGYRDVTTYTGALDTTRSKSVSRYLQGMDGDKKKDGTTRTVGVEPLLDTDVDFAAVTDSDQYSGQLLQKVTYDNGRPVSASYTNYTHKDTASQSVPDATDHTARWVRPNSTYGSTYLTASKTWRTHVTTSRYDDLGFVTSLDDYGQRGLGGDETCTRTWYARNDDLGINSLASRTRTVGKECSVADTSLDLPADDKRRGDVLADTATGYDGAGTWSASMKPTGGLVTWTGRAKGYVSGTPAWQTATSAAVTDFDAFGRPLKVTNADGQPTVTAYTPATAGPVTKTITTDPKGFKTTSFLDHRTGQPLRTYDANLKKTEFVYDALGRVTEVWLPNRDRGSQSATFGPNTKFEYRVSNTDTSWVSTAALKRDGETYATSYAIYDSMLRPLQTQTETSNGGRLLTDTRYDTRGLAYETYANIFDTTSRPDGTYTRAEYGEAPNQTGVVFDGAGRPTKSTFHVFGVEKWSTSTSYTGDSTATTALEGGTASRTITDVRGRTVEGREYAGTSPADTQYGDGLGASYASMRTTYTRDGRPTRITGPDDAKWTYTYDLFGRAVTAEDPDMGASSTEYDVMDRAVRTTDSRGKSILTGYDELGRTAGTWAGTKTDATQLTGHTYDTVADGKGLPATSTRFVGGRTGKAYVDAVTEYDTLSNPVASTLQLPADDPFVKAGAPATLAFRTAYNLDGTVETSEEPALGGLPSEIIDYTYNDVGQVTSVGGSTGYLLGATYSPLGQPWELLLGTATTTGHKKVSIRNTFEDGTGRLLRSNVKADSQAYMLQDLNYGFDQAGNIESITDPTTLGGTSSAETQCFAYDGHRRLVEAWTPSTQKCDDARDAGKLSGPAPYWTSYTYNTGGQRTGETTHRSAGDTRTTYCYTKTEQPHFLTGTTQKGDCATPERTYTPDATGNTTKRPGASGTQDLVWSEEGKLAKLTESGKATDYLYGSEGDLLIRNTAAGERVLYAGATELHLRADGTTWAQRYYAAGDQTVAIRSNESGSNKLTYLAGDHHGTQSLAIGADSAQTVSKRHMTPFGAERGAPVGSAWPDDKGFLGRTSDETTGLTHMGARQYDPAIGQFISVDPVLDPGQPQSLNGYSYANNTPVTASDPSGLWCDSCNDGKGWTRPDGGTKGDPNGGKNPDGSIRGTPGFPSSRPVPAGQGSSPGAGKVITNLGHGTPAVPPPDVYRDYQAKLPGVAQMSNLGTYMPELSYALNVELYFRERCSLSFAESCFAIRDFYTKGEDSHGLPKYWAHVDDIPIINTCPICQNIGFQALMTALPVGKFKFGPKCFLAGTDVLMADGAAKDIEDIEVGDMVMATDPETGEEGSRRVTRLIRSEGEKELSTLTMRTPDGPEELTATREHPFWSPSERAWVEAGDLAPGMTLRTDTGDTVEITANRSFTKRTKTYNFTVEELHTYYVLAGSTPILVHNSCGPTAGSGASLSNLTGSERARIQNAANRIGQPISVVGSRSLGPRSETNPDGVGHMSDWDYVITGINSRTKHSVSSSLPKADITVGVGRQQDIFTGPLDTTKPHITFYPQGK